jgi:hypothetical protein
MAVDYDYDWITSIMINEAQPKALMMNVDSIATGMTLSCYNCGGHGLVVLHTGYNIFIYRWHVQNIMIYVGA